MKTLKILVLSMIALLTILAYSSCKKSDGSSGSTQVNIAMAATAKGSSPQSSTMQTNVPITTNIDHLYLDIQQVSIKTKDDIVDSADDESEWISLATNENVYDLINFRSGNDTLIAQGTITAEAVKEIRLVLGTNNTVVIGGVTYPLTIPSGMQSGLKIKINESLNVSTANLLMEFDPEPSIFATGTGSYVLKPVIRIKRL